MQQKQGGNQPPRARQGLVMSATFARQIKDILGSDQRGTTALEYSLIASLLAMGLVGSLAWFSPWFNLVMSTIGQGLIATP